MAIADDFSVAANGDIRYTGTTANYTVIEFHRYLGGLMDDAQASGDDVLDITDATASARSTDNFITLNSPYNIDDVAMEHLYDGSIVQDNGDTIYDGIVVFAPAGTPVEVIQAGTLVSPNFWGTSYNPLAASGISHRFMVKVRTGAADIAFRRLIGISRDFGFGYSEFNIAATSRGNNVLSFGHTSDLNNATAAATVKGWTTITNTTEGYALLDVNNDTTDEPYYSEWNIAAMGINDLYERMKYLTQEPVSEDTNADTGSAFQLGNATITGQAQSFSNGVNATVPLKATFNLRKVGSPTGAITCNVYAHSGVFGSSSVPTGATLLASSTFEAADLTTTYQTIEFGFPVVPIVELTASTNYVVALEKAVGDGSNYVEIEGLATTGSHAGNRSQEVGTWSATATDDLGFTVFTTVELYGLPGTLFRGITHEWDVDGILTGPLNAFERLTWPGGGVGQMIATDSVSAPTKVWLQLIEGSVPADNTTITAVDSTTTFLTEFTTGSSQERNLPQHIAGISTGSALIGAYGFGVEVADLLVNDSMTDLTDTVRNPPNNVTFNVGGLVSGEDRLLVAPLGYRFAYDNEGGTPPFQVGETLTFTAPAGTATLSELLDQGTTGFMVISDMASGAVPADNSTISGGTSGATADVFGDVVAAPDTRQMNLSTALTGATETAVVVNSIPTDTPQTGTLRIKLDSEIERVQAYTSWTGSTFTIASTDYSGVNQAAIGQGVYIAYIDKLAAAATEGFTLVYSADRNVFVRVRDGGTLGDALSIKTFETSGTMSSTGGSATAIRTSDE
jgi:hypothetical protein